MGEPLATRAGEPSVLVVGAGFAGVAAAWAARQAGARVQVVSAGAGASELYSGLADGAPNAKAQEIASALGLAVHAAPRAVATREGFVRLVLGRDRAVLDLEALSGRTIAVVDLSRDDFDAGLLAKSLEASAWARSTRTRFVAVPVEALESGPERRFPPFDFARVLENPERVRKLARLLASASAHADGFLLGPWLGIERPVAEELTRLLARPVGETASGPEGAAGARFAVRRRELFGRLEIELAIGR
ncbi:MAG: FAD-binding protein, partial [Pseudomonadota bacterium]